MKSWVGKIGLALLAPLLLIGLLEGTLALLGLFPPPRLIETREVNGVTYAFTNPTYLRRFFNRVEVPSPPPIWTPLEKPAGTRRVLLLGESAAAGFPVMTYHLARLLETAWNAQHPADPIEVLNLAAVAINSHVLLDFARETMVLNPDLVIVYAGHNEVIGPFGPAAKFGAPARSRLLVRAHLALTRSRIGQGLAALMLRRNTSTDTPNEEWTGLNEFQDVDIAYDDPRLDTMLVQVERNFRDIVSVAAARGAQTVFAVPAVNLTDWEPSGSEPTERSVQDLLTAQANDALGTVRSANQAFAAARHRAEAGRMDLAWPLYRRACDLDTKRLRADQRIRDLQRRLADTLPDAFAVDLDRWLHEENPTFTTDRAFFLEHVHLTFTGRVAVTAGIMRGLENHWHHSATNGASPPPAAWWNELCRRADTLRERVLFTPYDDHDMWSLAWRLLRLDVFKQSPFLQPRRRALSERVTRLKRQATREWNAARIEAAYAAAQRYNATDPDIHFTAGRLLGLNQRWQAAERAYRAGFALQPNRMDAYLDYALLQLHQRNFSGAQHALEQAQHIDPTARDVERVQQAVIQTMMNR